ncbi:MAG: hypothetical protein ACOY3P_21320, partial [Planctomycetota bacterium]
GAFLYRLPRPRRLTLANTTALHDRCRITAYSPKRVEVEVRLTAPATLVLTDQYFPGWLAAVTAESGATRRAEVRAVDGVFRGVDMKPGDRVVAFCYRPTWFYVGAFLSAAAWAALAIATAFRICPVRKGPAS